MNMKVLEADDLFRYCSKTIILGMSFSETSVFYPFTLVTRVEFLHFEAALQHTLPCRRVCHA